MSFFDLPEEILIIIIKYLDIKSLYNLYTACEHIRYLVRMYGVIKKCDLSLSVMGTAETLKLNFFKDMSRTLKELNISGVSDLNKTILLLALRRLKCLITLNVAYTNIDILDLVEMYKVCPSIKNICINFTSNVTKIVQNALQFQEMFKNFLNVHFVGSTSLLCTRFAYYILQKARLKSLQFTVTKMDQFSVGIEDFDVMNPPFENFTLQMLKSSWESFSAASYYSNISYGFLHQMPIFSMLSILNYEILIMMTDNSSFPVLILYSSPIFKNFFNENFNMHPQLIDKMSDLYNIQLEGSIYIRFWNKDSTKFDSNFFSTLRNHLNSSFPYSIVSSKTPVPSQYEWYITCPTNHSTDHKVESGFKRKRIATPNYELNYDTEFQEMTAVQLTILFNEGIINAVTVSPSCRYLRKLTYLSLSGVRVRYTTEFFNILFRCCEKLITLNVDVLSVSTFYAALSRSLPLSQSLKNLRLVDRRIDLKTLFSSMSQCSTLENIHVMDTALDLSGISDPSVMFEKCVNLYCLYIYLSCSESVKKRQLQVLKKAKANCNKNINVNVFDNFHFDPYCNVFNIYRMKPEINI